MPDPFFQEMLAVDHRRALEFFVVGLSDVMEAKPDRQELLYNASVLAHYSQTSCFSDTDFPAPQTLSVVFDNFVMESGSTLGVAMLETAGNQCLLMSGFFASQMGKRHNLAWYSSLGAGFFYRASVLERSPRKAELFRGMAGRFEVWRLRHARLGRELQGLPYLLEVPKQ